MKWVDNAMSVDTAQKWVHTRSSESPGSPKPDGLHLLDILSLGCRF